MNTLDQPTVFKEVTPTKLIGQFVQGAKRFARQTYSRLSRGIGKELNAKKATAKEKAAEVALENSNLDKIKQTEDSKERLQLFDPLKQVLFFACGDGKRAVYVSSEKQVKNAAKPFKTKLRRKWVEEFVSEYPTPDGKELLKRLQDTLARFLHFADKRVYVFESLWIIGTYLYSVFGHYGYLFVFSQEFRCGKTRNLEIVSHLAYEATKPLNAPTTATIREIAAIGKTAQIDTVERWRGKSSKSHAAAMELLDAGFRKGGKVANMVHTGRQGNWRITVGNGTDIVPP